MQRGPNRFCEDVDRPLTYLSKGDIHTAEQAISKKMKAEKKSIKNALKGYVPEPYYSLLLPVIINENTPLKQLSDEERSAFLISKDLVFTANGTFLLKKPLSQVAACNTKRKRSNPKNNGK